MNLQKYQEAIEQNNIVSKTDLDGIISFVNDEFCKISGYSREELLGQNHNIVRHPDVAPEVFANLWNTISAKKTYTALVKNRRKDGSSFYVNTTIIPMLDEDDNIIEYIAIRYDVTEVIELTQKLKVKESELELLNATLEQRVTQQTEELMELNAHLEEKIKAEVQKNREKDRLLFQQARLASMGEMIANIAHQWRQPLSELGIVLFSMKKNFELSEKKDFMGEYASAKNVIKQMSQTIEDFRNFFNPSRKKEVFFIQDALRDTVMMMSGTLKKDAIDIKIMQQEKLSIKGFSSEFSQVFINLISNSRDAFKRGNLKNKQITINISKIDKDYVIIDYSDNAGGIDDAIITKIFEPYFTTKHASKGTGLGLYMSNMIIQNSMSGTIEAKNYNSGVLFSIKIPTCGRI